MALVAVTITACDPGVEPKPIQFNAENEVQNGGFYAEGPTEYKILEQRIAEDVNSRFTIKKSCAGVVLKPAAKEVKACLFEIEAKGLLAGEEATLETIYEPVGAKVGTPIRTTLRR